MIKRCYLIFSVCLVTAFLLAPTIAVGLGSASSDSNLLGENEQGFHYLTRNEMEKMKASLGVRDPQVDYNIIIDGHNTGLAPPTEQAWEESVGRLKIVDDVSTMIGEDPVPRATLDLSANPCFPIVGDQQLGSCGAWAMTYYSYGYLEAVDNDWTDASTGNQDHLMSPVWTYNKVNGGTDSGSWMWDNGYILQDWGGAPLSGLGCAGDPLPWGDESCFRNAPLHRAGDVTQMTFNAITIVNDIKALLGTGLPVTFTLDAGEYAAGFADGNYVLSSTEYDSGGMNHANTIVGYDDGISDDMDLGAFRVVNSWGDWWGDSGYYWLTYNALKEIGNVGQLYPTYIEDIPDYIPTLLGSWHFNTAPSRNVDLTMGIGTPSIPILTKTPYYNHDGNNAHRLPTYMSLDISEFKEEYDIGTTDFYLDVGSGGVSGTLSSFRVELYENDYDVGMATQTEAQSPDVPVTTPNQVTNVLNYYTPITINEAVDLPGPAFTTSGVAGWVGENYLSFYDGDAMQTGDVGDGESSHLQMLANGPDTLTFQWKVSSEFNNDFLRFYLDSSPMALISGDVDWQEENIAIPAGSHTLEWSYIKDSTVSEGEDSGWVDMVYLENLSEPVVMVNSPNGGELFAGGSACTITWTAMGGVYALIPNPITIEYSTTGPAGPWTLIATNEANDGTYNWDPLPLIDSTSCFVRVTAEDVMGGTGDDVSDGGFEIDSTAPAPATNVRAELTGISDVTVYWDASPSIDIDHYELYYILNGWDPTGDIYNYYAATTLTEQVHSFVGVTSGNSYFYQVRAYDTVGHETRTLVQAGKLGKTLSTFTNPSGWFMLGSFILQSDTAIDHVLQGQGFPSSWNFAQSYDTASGTWVSNLKGRPSAVNDMTDITNTEAFWLHITGNSRWTTAGQVTDMNMDLTTGWNLVPYPFVQRSMTAADIESHLMANCPNFDGWEVFDSSQDYRLNTPTGSEPLFHGDGFWIKVTADTTWTITNY